MSALSPAITSFVGSSIGRKILVALTGAVLVLFVLGHMIGNLLIFVGPGAINEYGHFLQTVGHGMGVWVARLGLLVCLVVHVVFTVKLTKENRSARSQAYGVEHTQVASKSSKLMILSGLTLLAFVVYHIAHFTLHVNNDYGKYMTSLEGHTVHDVYRMVIAGFSWLPAVIFYIIAMACLCSHLSHGVSSMFQTIGLATQRTLPVFRLIGRLYAAVIFIGNCSIPLAVYLKFVH